MEPTFWSRIWRLAKAAPALLARQPLANARKIEAEAEGILLKERSEAVVRLIGAGVDPERAAQMVGWGPAPAPGRGGDRPLLPVPPVVRALPPPPEGERPS